MIWFISDVLLVATRTVPYIVHTIGYVIAFNCHCIHPILIKSNDQHINPLFPIGCSDRPIDHIILFSMCLRYIEWFRLLMARS